MPALNVTRPTLLDVARATDPDGSIAAVGEVLSQTNEVLADATWMEGNLVTGHRSTIRTGYPAATFRKLYGGVQPSKGTVATIQDTCGELSAYAEIDKRLADMAGNANAFRLIEDRAHLEGMNNKFVETLFLGNEAVTPEGFTGFAPRYNSLSAANGGNIVDGGAAGGQTDANSIWLVVWDPSTVTCIYPKGMKAGLEVEDKGQVTIQDIDGNNGRMEAYATRYAWHCGLHVKDWRYVVRIANIDKSTLTKDAATGADLSDLMFQALRLVPSLNMGRPAFYMSRSMLTFLGRQTANKTASSTLKAENVGGHLVESFNGIPVRRVDVLAADEALVS